MKILIASTLYHPTMLGGAEKIAQIVAEGLRDAGHEVAVVTTCAEPGHRTAQVNGVTVHYVGLKNLYWPYDPTPKSALHKALWHLIDTYNPRMGRIFDRILALEKPDAINTHSLSGFSSAIWRRARLRGIPVHHTLHDYSLMCPKATMYKAGKNCTGQCGTCRMYTAASKHFSGTVSAAIGVSKFTLERHLQAGYFKHARVRRTIHNGLPEKNHPQRMLQPGPAPLCIGYVGRLVPQKGVEMLLQAMPALAPYGCTLMIGGRGTADYESYLKQRYASDTVRFLGFVDPDTVYAQIDVLVVPSLWEEPLGTIVLEAYACGIPVIVADSGGMKEMVEHERTGFIFDRDDPHALQAALLRFVLDRTLAPRLQEAVRIKSRDFTLERMKADYLAILQPA